MEQIIVKHNDGTQVAFPNSLLCAMVTSATITHEHQSTHTLSLSISSASPIDFTIGDTITILGTTYTLLQVPHIVKSGERNLTYELTLEAPQYRLIDVQFLLPVDSKNTSLTGDIDTFLDVIIDNANRTAVPPITWQKGSVSVPEIEGEDNVKTIDLSDQNCLSALQELCRQFEVEFRINQSGNVCSIDIAPEIGDTFPVTFAYGRGKGLYSIERTNADSKDIITRLYVYGSGDNLPNSYKASHLCLPDATGRNDSYIEDADKVALYGIREGLERFSDIKPKRVGSVSATSHIRVFTDTSMDFDLNEKDANGNTKWLISGETAKIMFQTGNLAGYAFDLNSYDHAKKQFVINGYEDENGYEFPNPNSTAFQFNAGDKYIITGIRVPQSYIDNAEAELLEKAQETFSESSQPQVNYALSLDPNYLAKLYPDMSARIFQAGDYVKVYDSLLASEEIATRISSMTINLLQPYSYELTLGDSVSISTITRMVSEVRRVQEIVQVNDLDTTPAMARRWRATEELKAMVFDPEGDYYSEKIKPLSIETTQLSVGARSQQMTLVNVRFQSNPIPEGGTEQDPNALKVIGGSLNHYTINPDGSIKTWTIASTYISGLTANQAYYVYAKCSRSQNSGTIVTDNTSRVFDADPSFYYFLIGTLSSVDETLGRMLSLTYGSTTINGEHVHTGIVESNNGKVRIDLNNGAIYAEDGLSFLPTGSTTPKQFKDYISDTDSAISSAETNAVATALSNTETAIKGIEIGTRNLFLKSSGSEIGYAKGYKATLSIEDNTLKAVKAEEGRGGFFVQTEGMSPTIPTSKCNWIVSVEVKGSVACTMNLGSNNHWSNVNVTTEWTRVSVAKTNQPIATMTFYPVAIGTFYFRNWKLEEGNKLTGWSEAPEDAENRVTANLDSINTTLTGRINELQNQVDQRVDYWYLNGTPTLSNAPANEWTTETLRKEHEGDEYLDLQTNKVYRFIYLNNLWQWKELSSSEASEALLLAQDAKAVADGKRRVFVTTPYVPYDEGDLWIEEGKELMVCATPKTATQTYNASDFVDKLQYAQRIASAEQNAKNYADTSIDSIQIGTRNIFLKSDGSDISTLRTYLASASVVDGVVKVVRTEGNNVGGVFIKTDKMSALLPSGNANWVLSVDLKADAQQVVYLGIQSVKTSNVSVGTDWGRYTLKGASDIGTFVFYANAGSGTFYMRNWQLEIGTKATDWTCAPEDTNAEIASAFSEARQAQSDATTARQKADQANQAIASINDDDIFSISEKYIVQKEYTEIAGQTNTTSSMASGNGSYAKVKDKATALGISYSDCSNKGYTLRTMMNALELYNTPLNDTSFTDKGYTRSSLTSVFREYYNAEQALWDAINEKLADIAEASAISTALTDATTKANNALASAKSYTDTEVATAESNAKTYANGMLSEAKTYADTQANQVSQDYAYIKDSMHSASNQAGLVKNGLVLGSFLGVGKYQGDPQSTPLRPELWELTAGMSGELNEDLSSVAFFAGGNISDINLPFYVRHNGEVGLRKAIIQSGDDDEGVTIANGEVRVGGFDGTRTTLTGREGGGVVNMRANAEGGVPQKYTNSAVNNTSGTASYQFEFTCEGSGGMYEAQTESITALSRCAIQLNTNPIVLSGIYRPKFKAIGRKVVVSATCDDSRFTFTNNASDVRYATFTIEASKDGVTWSPYATYGTKYKGVLPDEIPLSGGGWYYRLIVEFVVYLTATIKGNTSVAKGTKANVSLQASCLTSISATTSSDPNTFQVIDFNNTIYRDGMFISTSKDRWMAQSAVGDEMQRIVSGANSGFSVDDNGVHFVINGSTKIPFSRVLWSGYIYGQNLGSNYDIHGGTGSYAPKVGILTLGDIGRDYNGTFSFQFSGNTALNGTRLCAIVSPQEGYETEMKYAITDSVISNGVADFVLSCSYGTNRADWWDAHSHTIGASGTAKNMRYIRITIIGY